MDPWLYVYTPVMLHLDTILASPDNHPGDCSLSYCYSGNLTL